MFKGIAYLFKLCWKTEKMYIISLLVVELLNAIIMVASMVMSKYIIDELFIFKRLEYIICYICVYLGVTLIGYLLISYFKFLSEKKRDCFYTKFSLLNGRHMLRSDYQNLENPSFLDLRDKAMKYMNTYGFAGIIPTTTILVGKLFVLLSIIAIISTLNISVLFIYLILVFIGSYIDAKLKKANIKLNLEMTNDERKSDYIKSITSNQKYSKEIRLGNLSNWILDKYSKQFDVINIFKKKRNKNNRIAGSVSICISLLQQLVSYLYLIAGVFAKGISMGSFTMYLTAINLFNSNVNDILNTIIDLSQYTSYFEPFKEFMEFPETLHEGRNLSIEKIKTDKYEIEFVNVSFKYPGQEHYALKDISLKIKSGKKISIVGENGAGKTTFIKLLIRLYDPTEGEILLNGIDIRNLNYDEYMNIFSVVFQDYKLFALSIRENIVLSHIDKSSYDRILKISEIMGISEKILSLENGLETSIYKMFDENGIEPSGGEGQKIAISRALYKNAPVVILDEPTSALDPRAESEIYMNFDSLVGNKTAIYISHRLASSKACDEILVFRDGQILEKGTHNELMLMEGLYAELFQMQAQFYKNN